MSLLWHICLITAFTLFAIVAHASDYQESNVIGGFRTGGYADTRINANTAVIYYDGTRYDSPSTIKKYLLYRAAQVTIQNGYDYFIIVSTNLSNDYIKVRTKETTHYVSTQPKMYDQYYTTTSFESVESRPSSVPNQPVPCHPKPIQGASAVIKMFNGNAPDIPSAYDAQDVIGHLAVDTF